MRILAGGPARETESDLFRLHVEGLREQGHTCECGHDDRYPTHDHAGHCTKCPCEDARPTLYVEIRHDLTPDDDGPRWHHEKIERVAKARQGFLDYITFDYLEEDVVCEPDALLLVDTDVILGPGVLERMWAVDADVVYGVFWTEADWGQGSRIWPQVWDVHPYKFTEPTWDALNEPGVHEVPVLGGGACTLIRGRGFESHYFPLLDSIRHLGGMWGGEDRTFCLGLETRGVRQVAVTGLPIVHCYGEQNQTPHALEVARREVGL